MGFETRPYTGLADLWEMRRFLSQSRQITGLAPLWHPGDASWRLFLQSRDGDPAQNMNLWYAGGELAGFSGFYVYPTGRCGLDVQCSPQVRPLAEAMLDWAEQRWSNVPGGRLVCDSGVCELDSSFIDSLERRGFQAAGDRPAALLLTAALEPGLPAVSLPEGFAAGSLAGAEQAGERATVHRAAFESQRMTTQAYERLMSWPGYRPELDWVVRAADGAIAAYAQAWLDEANRCAEFEPVGAHPALRGRGLGRAVLQFAMRRLFDLGMHRVVVGPVEAELEPFYRSAGFTVHSRWLEFEKTR